VPTTSTGSPSRRSQRKAANRTRPGAPLLSACMIVKDEQDDLPACLDALRGFAEEVVVYDTGSTDGTVELARAAGATVVEGYWDDDFARARNAALEHCTGEWILHVDADELVEGRLDALRRELRTAQPESLAVTIHNVGDDGELGLSHTATRLFRRGRARWEGALHEQVVSIDGKRLRLARSSLSLIHSGYTTAAFERKGKNERNLRVAQAAAERPGGADALAAVNLGRALRSSRRYEEALEQFERAAQSAARPAILRQARRFGAETLMDLGRSREALSWIEELRAHTESSSMPDYLEGVAHLNLLDVDRALHLLEKLDVVSDEDLTIPDLTVRHRRGLALVAAHRWPAAAGELRGSMPPGRCDTGPWAELVEAQWRAGLPLSDLLALLRSDGLVQVLGRVANAAPGAADAFAELLWHTDTPRAEVLALAAHIGGRLPLSRALEWSARLRSHGLTSRCAVAAAADNADQPGLERLRACAVLVGAFQDARGEQMLPAVAAALESESFLRGLEELDQLAPALLPLFVRSAATTAARSAFLARLLEQLGAGEAARELLAQPV
jgi:tetratricopeptide (TPR) repeat protein